MKDFLYDMWGYVIIIGMLFLLPIVGFVNFRTKEKGVSYMTHGGFIFGKWLKKYEADKD